MKTILDKQSGKVLYCTNEITTLQDNEIAVDELLTKSFISPFFNQNTREFYEGATAEEVIELENKNNIELKKQAHQLLSETDWYVTRFIETGKQIPAEILEQRQLIRNCI